MRVGLPTGVPLSGAYVKAYVQTASGGTTFHKDGYTDRRGLCDYWTLTSKPTDKVRRRGAGDPVVAGAW